MLTLLALLATVELARVAGTVTDTQGSPLPGITVTLRNSSVRQETMTNVEGRYAFDNVPYGGYSIETSLAGVEPQLRNIEVRTATFDAGAIEMSMEVTETLTIACPACDREPPENEYDYPICGDMDLHLLLIDALQRDDPAARAELVKRFATTDTYRERHRIASALIRRVPDDRRYWDELERNAQFVFRFPRTENEHYTPEYIAWCAERGLNPDHHWSMAFDALRYAGEHRRGIPMLLRSLQTNDHLLIRGAIYSLAALHAEETLPAIERMFERLGDDASEHVEDLAYFQSAAADALAAKFLKDDHARENYEAAKERVASGENR